MRIFTLIAACVALTACSRLDSGTIATEEIRAEIEITNRGDHHSDVKVTLGHADDSLAWISLTDGDALSVSADGLYAELAPDPGAFEKITYDSSMPTDRGEFRVVLDRPFFSSAPYSFVEMPRAFRVLDDNRAWWLEHDYMPIEWSNATGEEMRIDFKGDCIFDYSVVVADSGYFELEPGELSPKSFWDGDLCGIDVVLTRERVGLLDPTYASGFISARQERHRVLWVE